MRRRDFLQILAGAAVSAPFVRSSRAASDTLGAVLPTRALGASGIQVTLLGLGGFHIGWTTEELARTTIEAALEEGIRFFDTAESYGPHTSEERYGRYLTPVARDHIFLMTKSTAKNAALAQDHLEGSLRRMKTEVIDLWQLHGLETPQDVEERLQGGVLDYAVKAQAEGKIRHIGFTGHASPPALQRMLEVTGKTASPFAACQFPVNPVDTASPHSFVESVVPPAREQGLGVLAMKTLADGRFFGTKTMNGETVWSSPSPVIPQALTLADCFQFALSLPISVLITGAEKPEFVRDKAALVRSFQNLTLEQRQQLVARVARYTGEDGVEYYKSAELRG